MSAEMNISNKVPHKWSTINPFASEVILDKFLAFKTPLHRDFEGKLKSKEFKVSSVFDYLSKMELDMGLWIDLSIPNRYNKDEVVILGCQYIKVKCGMKGLPPSIEKTNRLINCVRDFIEKNPHKIVGIHCTQGHNRTGFIIVALMVEIFGWELEEAIAKFARARPPGIYRQHLLDELRERYSSTSGPNELLVPLSAPGVSKSEAARKCTGNVPEKNLNWRKNRNGPNLYFKNFKNNGRDNPRNGKREPPTPKADLTIKK